MVVVIVKVNLQTNLFFFLVVVLFAVMLVLSSNSLYQNIRPINRPSPKIRITLDSRLGIGPVDGPSALVEGVRRQHEHHNKQNNNKEEKKGWLAILLYNYHNHALLPVVREQYLFKRRTFLFTHLELVFGLFACLLSSIVHIIYFSANKNERQIVVHRGFIPYGISMYQMTQDNSDYALRDRKHHSSVITKPVPYD